MEVAGLGYVNSHITSIKNESASKDTKGFTGLYNALLAGSGSGVEKGNIGNDETIPNQDLQDILIFFNSEDVAELDQGLPLQAFLSDKKDIFSLIKDFLGMTDTDITNLVRNMQHSLGIKTESDDKSELNLVDFMNMIYQIVNLPLEDFKKVVDSSFLEGTKALKMYDLLTESIDSYRDQGQLKELLKQLTEKLEQLAINSRQASKIEFLQRTFTPIVEGVNQKNVSSKENVEIQQKPVAAKFEVLNGGIQFQQLSKPEQMTLMLDKAGKPVSTEQLIQQFENILSKSQFSKMGGTQKLFIKLNPEHLGALRVELIQRDSTIIAKIQTTTLAAKDSLELQLNALKQAFHSQNIQVERVDISQQLSQQERFFNKEQQQQGQSRQEQNQKYPEEEKNDQQFGFSLEDALLNTEV